MRVNFALNSVLHPYQEGNKNKVFTTNVGCTPMNCVKINGTMLWCLANKQSIMATPTFFQ